MTGPQITTPPDGPLAGVVERNIESLVERRRHERRSRDAQTRVADAITRFTGSMTFVYLHLALFGGWALWNSGWLGLPRFDDTFVGLATIASIEAIFLSTFVLISQNRMAQQAEARAELDVQISLLAEHELTRLITMTTRLLERAGVDPHVVPEIDELERDVAPHEVMDRVEEAEQRMEREDGDD